MPRRPSPLDDSPRGLGRKPLPPRSVKELEGQFGFVRRASSVLDESAIADDLTGVSELGRQKSHRAGRDTRADALLEVRDRGVAVGTDSTVRGNPRVTFGPQLVLEDSIGQAPRPEEQPGGAEYHLLPGWGPFFHAADGTSLDSSSPGIRRSRFDTDHATAPRTRAQHRHSVRMTIPAYESTITAPLTTDALIEERVSSLVGKACRRQFWLLFLDEDSVQLPLLIPIGDPPAHPQPESDALLGMVENAAESVGATSVVVVIERYADDTLTASDLAWAAWLDAAFHDHEIALRGMLLSHRRGVRWIAQDDYRF